MSALTEPRILLIEDNPADARLVHEMLREACGQALKLVHAENLQLGLQHLVKTQPEAVLLDLHLPDSSGMDTFRKLHQKSATTPILVLSGGDDVGIAVEAVQNGAQDYLVKDNITTDLLVRSLKYAIERQKMFNQLQEALANIKTLKGLLPICANCKKIRNDKGYWEMVESYISDRTNAEFTHGLCPECVKKIYPKLSVTIHYSEDVPENKH